MMTAKAETGMATAQLSRPSTAASPHRYVGFTAPDEFFVGYGFDLDGRYRGLPGLHVLLTN